MTQKNKEAIRKALHDALESALEMAAEHKEKVKTGRYKSRRALERAVSSLEINLIGCRNIFELL